MMISDRHQLGLYELLCYREFLTRFRARFSAFDPRWVVAWAEEQVMHGNSSHTLLILASLGLDKEIDQDEFDHYLARYLEEEAIALPTYSESGLVWLKLYLEGLYLAVTKEEIEVRLSTCVWLYSYDEGRFFSRVLGLLNSIYYQLFDDCGQSYSCEADIMSVEEIKLTLQRQLFPYYRRLCNADWRELLC